jgi:hypothetical protein
MAHLRSTSAARRSVGVIGLGQMGLTRLCPRIDERLEADAGERSGP